MCTTTHQVSGSTPAEVIPPSPARYWGVVPSQPAPQHNPIPTLNLLQQLSPTPILNPIQRLTQCRPPIQLQQFSSSLSRPSLPFSDQSSRIQIRPSPVHGFQVRTGFMKRSEQVSDMSEHTDSNSQRSRPSRSDLATRISSHLSRGGSGAFRCPLRS